MDQPEAVRSDRFAGVFGESVYFTRRAHPSLHPYVDRYSGYDEHTVFRRRREPPTAGVVVIVDLGAGLTLVDAERGAVRLDAFAAGPTDRAAIVDSGGRQTGIQVNLTLVGARRLLGVPLREITNRAATFDELFGAPGRRLAARLRSTESWQARFTLLDNDLRARLAAADAVAPDLLWAWHDLTRTGGQRTVGDLAAEIGCSRNRLSTRFATQFGLPPKTLAGVLRFRRAVDGLSAGTHASLADLAADCGYYDQAHLDRDFRRFAGITPTDHRRRYTPEFGLPEH